VGHYSERKRGELLMADYFTNDTDLTAVANAIRTKGGTTAPLEFPDEYIQAINDIQGGGGGGASKKQINFIDYDGTIVQSYTSAEWANVSALPDNPSHTGLVAQGWNWTKAQIDAQLTALPDGDIWVGQMYITGSGDTEIDVRFSDSARLSPILTICVNGSVTVDWGDNTSPNTVTGSSLSTRQAVPHTYASSGNYTIVIHVVSGSFQFYGSSSYYILRKNTKSNENRVYANCVENVRLGNGVTSIGNIAFSGCSSLTSITIPSGVTSIGSSAFNGCSSLTSITIPSGVTSIAGSTFYDCFSLSSIAIPSGVTSLANSVFFDCQSLASITIPSGVTSIGSDTFHNCSSLLSITIPSGVTSIESSTFYNCYSLASITISSGVTSIGGYAFNCCYSLASVTIPNSVTSILASAFNECQSLASITIPSGVTSIGGYAFYNCQSLASITIPSGVTSIGGHAFQSCYGMAEYHILPTNVPTLGTTVFANIPSDCKIYVPAGTLSNYQSATNWSAYASYMVEESAA